MAYGSNPYGGYNAYREIGVKTASQGKLVVMLYEGAVNNLEKAMSLIGPDGKINANQIESYGNFLQKVMDILTELEVSLDMDKGGEIAKNLMSLYVYFNRQILEATMDHKKEKLDFVHNMMSQLRESWITASNSTANSRTAIPGATPSFSIQG